MSPQNTNLYIYHKFSSEGSDKYLLGNLADIIKDQLQVIDLGFKCHVSGVCSAVFMCTLLQK